MHYRSSKRRSKATCTTTTVAAAALVLAACLGNGAGSSPSGYPGGAGGGGASPPRRPGQPPSAGGGYPPQQQQQYQQQQQQQQPNYRPGGAPPPGQIPPSSPPANAPPGSGPPPQGGLGNSPAAQQQQQQQQQQQALYGGRGAAMPGVGPGPGQQQGGYRGAPPSPAQQQQQQQGYGGEQAPPSGPGQQGQGGGGTGGGYGVGGGYPSGGQPAGYGGRPSYPPQGMQQQQPQQQQQPGGDAGGGFMSRLASKFKGVEGQQQPQQQQQQQGYGSGGAGVGVGGRYGGPGAQYPPQGQPPQGWQPPSRPGMAVQAAGPSRGPIQSGYNQDGGYGGSNQQQQQQQQGDSGIWSRFKGKVFQGDAQETDEGPPSFRPGGSVLKKKEEATSANLNAQAFGGPGAFGNPYPSFGGPPGMGMGGAGAAGAMPAEPSGPGTTEVISVQGSIVMVLKPNELAKKKRKFKQDGSNKLQVITTFDHCLTSFYRKDGKTSCLKTTDVLEQNQHVMLPEAAKKVRYLRSDFKRRMEADGKAMTPEQRVAALEDNLRKVYSVVAMEGGVHMNSIGPAIESQLDKIPLREGVDDMTAALAWRAIPMTIFCAGYGNVAMEVLRRGSPKITGPGGAFTPHLRLVANFFRPDDTMTIIGMYDTVPLIHEAKKSGATLLEFLRGVRQENAFTSRSNVLLLGSELSDLGLTSGLPSVEERISVGFLKLDEHVLEKLPRYAQAYDVVIIGDGDMSYANEILHEVVG